MRELALRQVAAQVDSDLVERMQGGAIEGPWKAGERLLVCIGPDAQAERLVREGKRLADLLDAPWFAVTIERPGQSLDQAAAARLDTSLQLAKNLGAETHNLVANDLPNEILRFSRFENVTQIVVGKARTRRVRLPFSEVNLADALVQRAKGFSVLVLTEREQSGARPWRWPELGGLSGYLAAIASVAAATALGNVLVGFIPLPNISMLYLLAVLVPALLFGVWPAVCASFLSFAAYNYLFLDPTGTFSIARPHELLALIIFLIIAFTISAVAGQAREQMRASARRTRATRRLYEFTRMLSALPDTTTVLEAAATEINAAIGRPVTILRPSGSDLAIAAAWPPDDRLDTPALAAARWAFDRGETAGAGTGTLPNSGWTFLPLAAPEGPVGVLGIERLPDASPLDVETRTLLAALAEQTAAALHRALLSTEVRTAKTAAETERVRNILLASISHDFRTPLASVLGAATALIEYDDKLERDARLDLLGQVRDEARHLDTMVRNLLSMTRLEAGALEINSDWVDVGESLERVVDVAKRRGASQRFLLRLPERQLFAQADGTLLDQAIGNIVGNAVRHAGARAEVVLSAKSMPGWIEIEIADDGPGVPDDLKPHVFEKFTRAKRSIADGGDSAGIGLAIAKGIVEAHGGTLELLTMDPVHPTGASFRIRIPAEGGIVA